MEEELERAEPSPDDWPSAMAAYRARFNRLLIGADVDQLLKRETFSPSLRDSIAQLLDVLDRFIQNRLPDGSVTAAGNDLLDQFFRRQNAWFSDESDTNKRLFRKEMTFRDPADESRELTCFWHGKIQTPPFRVHFEWPVPAGQQQLKVVYIGPKISKKLRWVLPATIDPLIVVA